MYRKPVRFLPGLMAIGVLALVIAGCGLHGGDSADSAACDNIQQEVQDTLAGVNEARSPDEAAKTLADAAKRIRDEGQGAGGDVGDAAEKVAIAMDQVAEYMRSLSTGDPRAPDVTALDTASAEFESTCDEGLHG